MIVVFADDFSGATEIAGAARAFGLRAEVQTLSGPLTRAEVLVIDTDSRSLTVRKAAVCVSQAADAIRQFEPAWVFKKVDSVLRGNVVSELNSLASAFGKTHVLLAPANPSRERVIQSGKYFVDGVALHQTEFANEYDRIAENSNVVNMLGGDFDVGVHSVSLGSLPVDRGISIVDAISGDDLEHWTTLLDESTLTAGAADFFEVVLAARRFGSAAALRRDRPVVEARKAKTLFVCGSAAAWQSRRALQCVAHEIPIVSMLQNNRRGMKSSDGEWAEEAELALSKYGSAMIAIGRKQLASSNSGVEITERLVTVAGDLVARGTIERICLEGGATAAAFVRSMNWQRLVALREYDRGIVVLLPPQTAVEMVVKPGSYDWPNDVWSTCEVRPG